MPPRRTIVLDPGHGGRDPGAVRDGVRESDLVLDIARRCRTLLAKRYAVSLTRDDDEFIGLARRREMATERGADVFVSIHVNAAARAAAQGYEVFYRPGYATGLKLAQHILHQFRRRWPDLLDRGAKEARFAVLMQPRPAVLVECFFISNPSERAMLQQALTRERLAEAIAWGIGNFLREATTSERR